MSHIKVDKWSQLCRSKAIEEMILCHLRESGLTADMKRLVGKEIDNPEVHINDVERATFSSFIKSG